MVNEVHGSTWLSVTWIIVFAGIKNKTKQNRKTVTMNLWHTKEEWVTEKSAEADTAADIITWVYARSNLTYNISGHPFHLQTLSSDNARHCFKTWHHCLMCSAVLWFKVSVYTHWLFNLLVNNLINHSTENKTNKMVCKYFHLPIKAWLAFPQMQ